MDTRPTNLEKNSTSADEGIASNEAVNDEAEEERKERSLNNIKASKIGLGILSENFKDLSNDDFWTYSRLKAQISEFGKAEVFSNLGLGFFEADRNHTNNLEEATIEIANLARKYHKPENSTPEKNSTSADEGIASNETVSDKVKEELTKEIVETPEPKTPSKESVEKTEAQSVDELVAKEIAEYGETLGKWSTSRLAKELLEMNAQNKTPREMVEHLLKVMGKDLSQEKFSGGGGGRNAMESKLLNIMPQIQDAYENRGDEIKSKDGTDLVVLDDGNEVQLIGRTGSFKSEDFKFNFIDFKIPMEEALKAGEKVVEKFIQSEINKSDYSW